MRKILLSILATQAIIYIVPFLVYGLFHLIMGLKPPEGVSPGQFLLSVFITKIGTAIAFVLILYFAGTVFKERWLLYAFLWWMMYLIGEIGQAIGPNYSWTEAMAGVISETIYFPLSGLVTKRLLDIN